MAPALRLRRAAGGWPLPALRLDAGLSRGSAMTRSTRSSRGAVLAARGDAASSRASRRPCTVAADTRGPPAPRRSCPTASGAAAGACVRSRDGEARGRGLGRRGARRRCAPGRADPLARRRRLGLCGRGRARSGDRAPAVALSGAAAGELPVARSRRAPGSSSASASDPRRGWRSRRASARSWVSASPSAARSASPFRRPAWSRSSRASPACPSASSPPCARSRRPPAGHAATANDLRALGGDAAVEELQHLPGVGPFTAQGIVVRGAGGAPTTSRPSSRAWSRGRRRLGLPARRRPRSSRRRAGAAAPRRGARSGRPVRRAAASSDRGGGVASRSRRRHLSARYPRRCRPGSRGGRDSPSRKVRTSQGEVVGRPTRGNPRESATETHRRWRALHVRPAQARVKWCGKSAPASW